MRPPAPYSVVGLGANLGSPLQTFERALQLLGPLGELLDYSAVYLSEAQGPPQPDYHNAAIGMRFTGTPEESLSGLLEVEIACGRVRRERWGARLLDLDWLWTSGAQIVMPNLAVPHPRLTQRAFALKPLLDVVPGATEPSSGRPYTHWLPSVEAQSIRLLESPGGPWRNAADCRT